MRMPEMKCLSFLFFMLFLGACASPQDHFHLTINNQPSAPYYEKSGDSPLGSDPFIHAEYDSVLGGTEIQLLAGYDGTTGLWAEEFYLFFSGNTGGVYEIPLNTLKSSYATLTAGYTGASSDPGTLGFLEIDMMGGQGDQIGGDFSLHLCDNPTLTGTANCTTGGVLINGFFKVTRENDGTGTRGPGLRR